MDRQSCWPRLGLTGGVLGVVGNVEARIGASFHAYAWDSGQNCFKTSFLAPQASFLHFSYSKLLEDKQPFKFGVGSLHSTTNMASSLAPASVLDDHCFRKEFNQQLFESHVRRKKVIPEVGFNLNDDEYPQIMEQISLRGWRRLASPMTRDSKLLVQEYFANATVSDEEVANAEQLMYEHH
ncbi:hypothetical protein PIB30_079326 [Stylosanthes scabra]|uniref:Uncharacterized protein n=1 Tax=Stylosanthes scabra TaxID=79078 RepID=A0ABU6TQN5_9FABA|nr:hypothetical protein [Stylosanthes scabra]